MSAESRLAPCRCCGFHTLSDPLNGSYEICPVCFWEDDPVQNGDPLFAGGANDVSLAEAKENYASCGASTARFAGMVRAPLAEEIYNAWNPVPDAGAVARRMFQRGIRSYLLEVATSILSGRVRLIDGCCAIASVEQYFSEREHRILDLGAFVVIASEVEGRQGQCDEMVDFVRVVAPQVESLCRRIAGVLKVELHVSEVTGTHNQRLP